MLLATIPNPTIPQDAPNPALVAAAAVLFAAAAFLLVIGLFGGVLNALRYERYVLLGVGIVTFGLSTFFGFKVAHDYSSPVDTTGIGIVDAVTTGLPQLVWVICACAGAAGAFKARNSIR